MSPSIVTPASRMRQLIARPGTFARPACFDPLTARIAQATGFEALGVSGFAMGAHMCTTEPLLTLTELADRGGRIQAAVDIPAIVDVGAGFGEAINVWHTVREMERAGVAGIQMEDQVYPKRAHYHRDYIEHTIDAEHMLEKVQAFVEARRDPDFILLARTDAFRTHGYDEGVRRANLYAEAGADLIMLFPNDAEELKRAPKDVAAPLVYVVSHGNRVGRPVPTFEELEEAGYKVASYAILSIIAAYEGVSQAFRRLRETGDPGIEPERAIRLRKEIEDLIGLEKLYEIEERTTEKR